MPTKKTQKLPRSKFVIIPEKRMIKYIQYLQKTEEEHKDFISSCPTCGQQSKGLREYPYFYDATYNDVYFASVCPHCGEIMISKE